jgi:hypothetical protein
MNDDIARRVKEAQSSEVFKRVKEIQASMVESAKSSFDDSELGPLRAVIRITVEFHDYLEHGSVDMARGMLQLPYVGLTSEKFQTDLQNASADPSNKYDLGYICHSILPAVDSFCNLNSVYSKQDRATSSRVEWDMISSRESFKAAFVSMYNTFTEEVNFENKCRLLLDLFKLQIVFAGISYDD